MSNNANSSGKTTRCPASLWIDAFDFVARHFGTCYSATAGRHYAETLKGAEIDSALPVLAHKCGLQIKRFDTSNTVITRWKLPLILHFIDGEIGVITSLGSDDTASVVFSGDGGCVTKLPLPVLIEHSDYCLIVRPRQRVPDERVDAYTKPPGEHWLRSIALKDLRYYSNILLASLVSNILALATVIFSMQVYDRVIPSKSFSTLYVLFSGVLLALFFDFLLRSLRTRIIDVLGKRTDLEISDIAFGHALRVKNQSRPTSTGTFIAQLRDLEQVRELLTSTTVAAFADIPFFLLFLFIFWTIGGTLVLIPLCAFVLLVLPGILLQGKLRTTANLAMRESTLRNALLVEAIQGIDDIKALQVEDAFQQKWNQHNAVAAQVQLKLRSITNGLTAWSSTIQNLTFSAVIVIGVPMVIDGDMTTGALFGCSILGSRMMAPMAQLTQILGRYQQAKVGLKSIDTVLSLPTDHPGDETRISSPSLSGSYKIEKAVFYYCQPTGNPALTVPRLSVDAGEKIAILGRNGAGKSTLLLGLAGMLEPAYGEVLIDDLSLKHIDPADLRSNVGLITQDSRLFHGTIRDNITMGARHATDDEIVYALKMTGAHEFIRKTPLGLDHIILEGGRGLSGGQKQALMLSRVILRDPSVVLFDEPTAAMDESAEREFVTQFGKWSVGKTVIIASHRMRVLDLVDRILIIENGKLVKDGPKQSIIEEIRGGTKSNRRVRLSSDDVQNSAVVAGTKRTSGGLL